MVHCFEIQRILQISKSKWEDLNDPDMRVLCTQKTSLEPDSYAVVWNYYIIIRLSDQIDNSN